MLKAVANVQGQCRLWPNVSHEKYLEKLNSCADHAFGCSLALPVYSVRSQRTADTHPHTSFQTHFGDDGPERDASLESCWPCRCLHPWGPHTHMLSIRAWWWCFLLGTDDLVRIGWLREIHRATFIGCQGHWCYVWSLRKTERNLEKEEDREKVVKNCVGVSLPVGSSFESEEDPFVIYKGRIMSHILTMNKKTVICGKVLYGLSIKVPIAVKLFLCFLLQISIKSKRASCFLPVWVKCALRKFGKTYSYDKAAALCKRMLHTFSKPTGGRNVSTDQDQRAPGGNA